MRTETTPQTVAVRRIPGGESRDRWSWVKREAWSDRMLEALKKGVRGGRWHSLIDKVFAPPVLRAAYERVRRNRGAAGADRESVARFTRHAEENLQKLHVRLRDGHYEPVAVLRRWIDKPGTTQQRPLGVPAVRDRVVQTALLSVLEPIFEVGFDDASYGFRPGRGCKDALRRVDQLLRQGHSWVVDADIRSYFDTIDHAILMGEVRRKVSDGRVLELLEKYLKQKVLEGVREWTPDEGTPQGAVISPLLANIYLDGVDQRMRREGFQLVRYADDLVILCRSAAEADQALRVLHEEMERLRLTLHPEKTRVVDATQPGGFDFLGYHFERGKRWPRRRSLDRLKDKIREKTKRTNGYSLDRIITEVNPVLRGWFGYFQHSIATTFSSIDGLVRRRLRSILRKRQGRKGTSRGVDHQRWPNSYFKAHGLFTLTDAHAAALQSYRG